MIYLFICLANSCRSQMAEAYFNHLHLNGHQARSCGLSAHPIHSATLQILRDKGINTERLIPKQVDSKMIQSADVIVLLDSTLKDRIRIPSTKLVIEHPIEDPMSAAGQNREKAAFTEAFSDIKSLIEKILT